jgi:hypothetical protein
MSGLSPLIDPLPLRLLCSQLGGDTVVRNRFVTDFVALWTSRQQHLGSALAVADLTEADVVLLSIRSSSHMLGAVHLDYTAGLLRGALNDNDLSGCRQQLPRLSAVGVDTCLALSAHITGE